MSRKQMIKIATAIGRDWKRLEEIGRFVVLWLGRVVLIET
jgi:hypothetical protein